MKNLTVVTDPGIDDLVALVLLFKLDSKIKVNLISTFGNAPEEITARNVKEFISFVAPSWKFIDGSSLPLNGKVEHKWPDYFHGPDGVWRVHPEVDISKIKSLTATPNSPSVVSLAPLTDTYKLCKDGKIKNITLMGGAFLVEGNETRFAETNIAFDPDAAYGFFNGFPKIQVKVVPLDVTRKVFWTEQEIRNIPEAGNINIWLKKLLSTWFKNYSHQREENFNLHDPLAVYLNYFPKAAKWFKSGVYVEIKGDKRGQTIFNSNNPECEIAMRLTNPSLVSKKIYDVIFK